MQESKILAKMLGTPKATNPVSKAVAKRLGLDTPTGKTAFLSSFKSSTDDLTGNSMSPEIGQVEFLSKLKNSNTRD